MNKLLVPLFAIALPVVGDAATAPAAPVQQQAVQQQPQWVSAQQQPQLQAGGFPAAPGTQPATPQQPYPTTNYGPTAYATNATTVPYSQNVVNQQGAVAVAQNNQNQPLPPLPPLTPPSKMEQASKIVAPLKPSEIRALRDQFEDVRRANAYQPLKAVPKISSLSVDLSPGSALPILRVLPGEMSTIVFVDATGAPWPLAAAPRVSDSTLFDVEWLEGTPSVVVSAMTTFQDGNITVFLQGLATPIVVKLATGEVDSPNTNVRVVDYRLDLRIPGRGPNAKQSIAGTAKIGLYNDTLQAILDGIPPQDAKQVSIEGSPKYVQAWQIGDSLFLRTPLNIQTAYDQTLSSADGTHVYELPITPFVSLSQDNRSVTLRLDVNN